MQLGSDTEIILHQVGDVLAICKSIIYAINCETEYTAELIDQKVNKVKKPRVDRRKSLQGRNLVAH